MDLIRKILGRRHASSPAAAAILFRIPEGQGSERVDVRDPTALAQWSATLNVAPERLIRAVIVVGDRLQDVQHHLAMPDA